MNLYQERVSIEFYILVDNKRYYFWYCYTAPWFVEQLLKNAGISCKQHIKKKKKKTRPTRVLARGYIMCAKYLKHNIKVFADVSKDFVQPEEYIARKHLLLSAFPDLEAITDQKARDFENKTGPVHTMHSRIHQKIPLMEAYGFHEKWANNRYTRYMKNAPGVFGKYIIDEQEYIFGMAGNVKVVRWKANKKAYMKIEFREETFVLSMYDKRGAYAELWSDMFHTINERQEYYENKYFDKLKETAVLGPPTELEEYNP